MLSWRSSFKVQKHAYGFYIGVLKDFELFRKIAEIFEISAQGIREGNCRNIIIYNIPTGIVGKMAGKVDADVT